ncbi:thiamine pyrophosphate-binding protein [bacterium]|nr:thiamine pyrophosphate-binding protein [bacterium]
MGIICGGHVVAKYLKEVEGIDTVFSLSGGHIDRIYDGLFEYHVRLIDVRHEQSAAMMAHSWSIYKNKPGVCLVTAGPGFTNAITGIVNARMENAPIVVLCGTSPRRDWEKGALQDMDQKAMIRSVVKWQATCHDIKRIPEYLSTAFRIASSGRPGPVFLELPPDILNVSVEEAEIPKVNKGTTVYRFKPESSQLKEAAELISQAKNPIVLGGSGCKGCEKELAEFIDKTGCPFMLLNTGRGTIPDSHPLSLWQGGLMSATVAMSMADLVIILGVRLDWVLQQGQYFAQAKTVRIDIEPAEINRNRHSDIGLVGDMATTLDELNSYLTKTDRSEWALLLKESYLPMIQEELDARKNATDPIHPLRLVSQVKDTIGTDALYFADGGDSCYFGVVGAEANEGASVIGTAGGLFGCLGTGIPFGIGAKAARPDKTVVIFSGDGSFGLNTMEFDTAVRHNLPFISIVINDQSWGMIRHGQTLSYGGERVIGSTLGVVHYEKVAEGLGGYGEIVEKEADIVPAVKRALESGKPSCINVLTDISAMSPATLIFVESLKMEV